MPWEVLFSMATDETRMDSTTDVQKQKVEGGAVKNTWRDSDESPGIFGRGIMKDVTGSDHKTAMRALYMAEKTTGMLVGEKNREAPQTDWKRAMEQEMWRRLSGSTS